MAGFPQRVKVVEVGPRDGLQAEQQLLRSGDKVALIDRLSVSGLPVIEVTSFVSPEWIPQLADAETVWRDIDRRTGIRYAALVPNRRGLERALAAGVGDIGIFTAATDSFCLHNMNCTRDESLAQLAEIIERAKAADMRIRGYLSCVFGCPYEGPVDAGVVAALATLLRDMGCDEIALGDTIGSGTPLAAQRLVGLVTEVVPVGQLAMHFHDTRGQALANTLACLELGVSTFDAAVAGLGGCPYAPGASGNLATEDLVYMLEGMGIETGIDLDALIDTGRFVSRLLGRDNRSRVGVAGRDGRAR